MDAAQRELPSLIESVGAGATPFVYPAAGLLSRVLAHLGLDLPPEVCFGLGCELDFALPGRGGGEGAAGFGERRFHRHLSHALGLWFWEARTHTPRSFLQFLLDEWLDFAGKQQPLPILVWLPLEGPTEPALLLAVDEGGDALHFLSGTSGRMHRRTRAELEALALPEYVHAIFHPPLNFLRQDGKFRPMGSAVRHALVQTVHQLEVGFGGTGLTALASLARRMAEGEGAAEEWRELARFYLTRSRHDQEENGLFRRTFAAFLDRVGAALEEPAFGQAAELYRDLARRWSGWLRLCDALLTGAVAPAEFRAESAMALQALHQAEAQAVATLRRCLDGMAAVGVAG